MKILVTAHVKSYIGDRTKVRMLAKEACPISGAPGWVKFVVQDWTPFGQPRWMELLTEDAYAAAGHPSESEEYATFEGLGIDLAELFEVITAAKNISGKF